MSEFQFNTIDEILEDLRDGKIVVMIDDEDRENEGDVICAAEHATLENVNFMASYAKGLICMPMDESYTKKLGLRQMCEVNTDNHCTAFTVSIDHKDTTTGISAYERSITAMKTVDPDAVTTNGNLTMVNEYLAENGGAALGTDAVTPTPAASDGSGDNTDETGSDSTSGDGTDTSDTGDVADDGSDAGDDESSYDTGDGDTSQYDETDSYAGTEEGDMDEE